MNAALLDRSGLDSVLPVLHLKEAFEKNDLKQVVTVINALLKDVPSHLLDDKTEHFYHALVHLHFRYLGLFVQSEVHASDGRMDAVVQTPTHVYLLEFKVNKSAATALAQIKKKGYAEKFRLENKAIVGVGVNFDTEKKAVSGWKATPV